jgi:hypothetical protein
VVQKLKRTPGVQYRLEVLTEPHVLSDPALFVHYATGSRQRETDFNPMPGYSVDLSPGDIAIICSIR